jgi:putative hydrolase of the HAD superfamily
VIGAVGFDLDDTLMDHRVAVGRGLLAMGEVSGWPRRRDDVALWRHLERQHYPRFVAGELSFLDQRRERLSGFLAVRGIDPDGIDLDATFAEYFTHYESHWEPVKGARELLTAQRSAGRPVGVLTNGPRGLQLTKLERIGLADLVDVVLAIDDLPEGKPQPSAFLALCERLDASPADVAYVGDDLDADVRGARKAGLASVWFRRPDGVGFSPDPVPRVPVALDLAEVRRWLDTPVAPSRG